MDYDERAKLDLKIWQYDITKKPSFTNRIAKGFQNKVNSIIPDKVHQIMTEAIKNMVKVVLTGSEYTSRQLLTCTGLEEREQLVREKINFYKKAAAVSGAGTGAGGILLGLADFPILLSIKMKFLFDTAGLYGFDVKDYRERLYILYIFELAFSSRQRTNKVFETMADWDNHVKSLPFDINSFDWRTFQQEYRDYIDLAKMLQLVPGIGAVVGAYANYKLLDKLGETAINAYRMRILK